MIRRAIEWVSVGIEILAVVVIASSVVSLAVTRGTLRYLFHLSTPGASEGHKHSLGKALLLGLELLVAADVVRTVVLEPTLNNVVVLGLLVLVRTFLSWSMRLEIDGRWPWQSRARGGG